jgi:hypothetical protein
LIFIFDAESAFAVFEFLEITWEEATFISPEAPTGRMPA